MTSPELLKDLLVGGTALCVGLGLWVGILELRMFRHQPPHRRWIWGFRGLFLVGFAIMFAILAEALTRSPGIPPTWRAIGYGIGMVLADVGLVGITIKWREQA